MGTARADARGLQHSLEAIGRGHRDDHLSARILGGSPGTSLTEELAEAWSTTRIIDYDAKWSRDWTRGGNYPTLGGAHAGAARDGDPERHLRLGHAGQHAGAAARACIWTASPYADLRQLELVLTPPDSLKAALAATDATAITLPIVGRRISASRS